MPNNETLDPIVNPGGSTITGNLIIDSKFRRETSNFKVKFDFSSVDLTSEDQDPVLIKYIEKNLKPEELLGVIASVSGPGGAVEICSIVGDVVVIAEGGTYTLEPFQQLVPKLYYVPSTGALSLIGPYVEEEEGGETGESVIVPGGLPVNPNPAPFNPET